MNGAKVATYTFLECKWSHVVNCLPNSLSEGEKKCVCVEVTKSTLPNDRPDDLGPGGP